MSGERGLHLVPRDPSMPAERLRGALAGAAFPVSIEQRADLQRRLFDYVDALKGEACPPEQVVIAVKRLAQEALMHATAPLTKESNAGRADLVSVMVGWTIGRYYGR